MAGKSKERSPESRLTDLENAVLGVVWTYQPCSAYVVRREFIRSTSSYWSGSAGAIYPLMERLERLGLVGADVQPWGSRTKRLFSLTSAGRRALIDWITPPFEDRDVAPTLDPVRTRSNFLQVIPKRERRRFVDVAIRQVGAKLEALRRGGDEERERAGYWSWIAWVGTTYELEGRLRWLEWVKRQVSEK